MLGISIQTNPFLLQDNRGILRTYRQKNRLNRESRQEQRWHDRGCSSTCTGNNKSLKREGGNLGAHWVISSWMVAWCRAAFCSLKFPSNCWSRNCFSSRSSLHTHTHKHIPRQQTRPVPQRWMNRDFTARGLACKLVLKHETCLVDCHQLLMDGGFGGFFV